MNIKQLIEFIIIFIIVIIVQNLEARHKKKKLEELRMLREDYDQINVTNMNLKTILKAEMERLGKDVDGDVIIYEGKRYYVNLNRNQFVEYVPKNGGKMSWEPGKGLQ